MKKLLIGVSVIGLTLVGCSATPERPRETTTTKATAAPKSAVPNTTFTPRRNTTNPIPFASCKEAMEAGTVPIYPSHPRWNPRLDRDKDGMACEH